MRAIGLILAFSIVSFGVLARNGEGKNRNEIGMTLLSIKSNYGQLYSQSPYLSFFNGLDYKKFFGMGAFRLGIDYRDRNDKGTGDFIATSSYREGMIRTGYQRMILQRTIKPYIASDLIFLHSTFQHEFSGGFWSHYAKEDLKYNGAGFAPIMGLRIELTRTLSLSLETNVELLWIIKKGTLTENSPADVDTRITSSIRTTDFVIRMNPLNSVSLNFSF